MFLKTNTEVRHSPLFLYYGLLPLLSNCKLRWKSPHTQYQKTIDCTKIFVFKIFVVIGNYKYSCDRNSQWKWYKIETTNLTDFIGYFGHTSICILSICSQLTWKRWYTLIIYDEIYTSHEQIIHHMSTFNTSHEQTRHDMNRQYITWTH